jgi:hypothetical protein
MTDRLSEFIKYLNISVRSFEQKISASDGMIRRAINNDTDIQSKWITNIADNYPQLNIEWLLTGKGEMLKKDSGSPPVAGDNSGLKKEYELLQKTVSAMDEAITSQKDVIEMLKGNNAILLRENKALIKENELLNIELETLKRGSISA